MSASPSSRAPIDLGAFVRAELEVQGAVVEPRAPEDDGDATAAAALEAVLPETLARTLGVPAYLCFAPSPDAPLVRALVLEAAARVPVAHRCAAQLTLRLGGAQPPEPLNARLLHVEHTPCAAAYLTVHSRWELLADDRREGLVSATVCEATGGAAADPDEWPGAADLVPGALPSAAGVAPAHLSAAVAAEMRRQAETATRALRAALRRRLERDAERTSSFFANLATEMLAMVERAPRGAAAEARRRRIDKLEALLPERAAKLDALPGRYRSRLSLRPVAAVRTVVHGTRLTLRVQRRASERTVTAFHNPLAAAVDPPACDACFGAASPFALCDEALHVLCDACAGTRNRRCAACARR